MTSRERVRRTVNFQPADRVPLDLGGMKASGICVKAYNAVKARLGLPGASRVWDPKFMIACVEEAVRQRFQVDVAPLDISSATAELQPDAVWLPQTLYEGAAGLLPPDTAIGTDAEGRWALLDQDRQPTAYRMPKTGYYFDDISFDAPGAGIDPAEFRPATGFRDEQLNALRARGKFLHENTDYALLG
jgi:uroporphyrinogen decarboxylase